MPIFFKPTNSRDHPKDFPKTEQLFPSPKLLMTFLIGILYSYLDTIISEALFLHILASWFMTFGFSITNHNQLEVFSLKIVLIKPPNAATP